MIPVPEKYWENNAGHFELGIPWIVPSAYYELDALFAKIPEKLKIAVDIGIGGSTVWLVKHFLHTIGCEPIQFYFDQSKEEINLNQFAKRLRQYPNVSGVFNSFTFNDILSQLKSHGVQDITYLSVDTKIGPDRAAFIQRLAQHFDLTQTVIVQDNYAAGILWSNADELNDSVAKSLIAKNYPHKIRAHDDPHWWGRGTRIIYPEWTFPYL